MGVLSRQNHQKLYNVKDDQFVYTVSVAYNLHYSCKFWCQNFRTGPQNLSFGCSAPPNIKVICCIPKPGCADPNLQTQVSENLNLGSKIKNRPIFGTLNFFYTLIGGILKIITRRIEWTRLPSAQTRIINSYKGVKFAKTGFWTKYGTLW